MSHLDEKTIMQADQASRFRAFFMPFAGFALFSVQQWLFFGVEWDETSPVQLAVWAVLALLALLFLMTGGLWFRSRAVRTLANDEITERNRANAMKAGFLAAAITALIVFVVSPFEPLSAQRAAHIILSFGLGISLLVFGIEELRNLD